MSNYDATQIWAEFGAGHGLLARNNPQRCEFPRRHNGECAVMSGHPKALPLQRRVNDGHETFAWHVQMVAPDAVFTVAALADMWRMPWSCARDGICTPLMNFERCRTCPKWERAIRK